MATPALPDAVWELDAIGTRWRIETVAPLGPDARRAVTALIDGFDREWSRFRSPQETVARRSCRASAASA